MITNTHRGTIAMIIAASIWGSFSLIFSQLKAMPPIDIVAYRVVFGLITLMAWLAFKGRIREPFSVLKDRTETLKILAAAILIALNWLGFVYAISIGKALEASLGYFLFPLVTIALGTIIKKQPLNTAQWIAIMLAILAVCVLTYGLGKAPWIAIFLAVTFALYGLMKSNVSSGAVLSVAVENVLLVPFAIGWIVIFGAHGSDFELGIGQFGMLGLVGALTGIALMMMSFATKTISFFSVAMLSFLNPCLQAFNAVVFLGSYLSPWHKIALPLILLGCAIYYFDLWRKSKKRKSARPA